MILTDREIVEALVRKELSIEPFNRNNLTPNGYDLTIAEILVLDKNLSIKEGSIKISAKTWFVLSTKEYLKLRSLCAQLWLRTTFARKGIIGSFGKVDAGFEGNLTLSAFNASDKEVEINIGDRFAQIVFERLKAPELLYPLRSGNYFKQRGIKLAP
ncbi:MAG: dCTP deaminase [Candidatus Thermoplasmatota archaeon]|nr:dCTP deaminase [Candidatus Thermoplasmatota archaeon]MDI6855452.1 dCTP deaminase [Candidatus Thermoplasmatota archaeon]